MNRSIQRATDLLRQPRVAVALAISGSLLLGVGLGRHSGKRAHTPEPSSGAVVAARRTLPLSEEQLRRSGLISVRPELSTGTERPISGFVEAAVGSSSSVGMPVAGTVVRLLVAPGTTVRAGQPIAQVQSADAAVVRAEAEAAQATAQSLAYQYRLAQPMARQGALSAQELESRRVASVTAATTARAAAAKAAAMGEPNAMGRLLIRSPIGGRVSAVSTTPGAVLQAGADVAQIIDASGSEFRFLVSPGLAANLRSGQRLRVRSGSQTLQARVLAVAPNAGAGTRAMVLRARPVDGEIPPSGTAVTAFVQVPSSEQRWIVPNDAVGLINGAPVVFRYQRGMVESVPVVVGQQTAGQSEILQGVRQGDVLLRGNTNLLGGALAGDKNP